MSMLRKKDCIFFRFLEFDDGARERTAFVSQFDRIGSAPERQRSTTAGAVGAIRTSAANALRPAASYSVTRNAPSDVAPHADRQPVADGIGIKIDLARIVAAHHGEGVASRETAFVGRHDGHLRTAVTQRHDPVARSDRLEIEHLLVVFERIGNRPGHLVVRNPATA